MLRFRAGMRPAFTVCVIEICDIESMVDPEGGLLTFRGHRHGVKGFLRGERGVRRDRLAHVGTS